MVKKERIRKLNTIESAKKGPVVYWMSRDQRVSDNWALLYASECAKEKGVPLVVCFCIREKFSFATERLVDFMFSGLIEVEENLSKHGISFLMLVGEPYREIPLMLSKLKASILVRDFNPLKYSKVWNKQLLDETELPIYEVDAHNVVPVWVASEKQEFGAYTIRPKIHKLIPEYLEDFPRLPIFKTTLSFKKTNWELVRRKIERDKMVKPVIGIKSGERAGKMALKRFLVEGLGDYALNRNDPVLTAQSGLSPYFHFGQLSAQRAALEIRASYARKEGGKAFFEELVVRRELADNYCFYNENYDSPKGFPDWAKKTISEHRHDKREYVYTIDEFENSKTHDPLWNAAQNEMVTTGKMHGYMRMYWAKKILEWTKNVEDAMSFSIYLNDKYELDGRDPNGYTGIAWSIGGVHDRAWFDRKVFGKIRYMSFGGAKSKFDVEKYINKFYAHK